MADASLGTAVLRTRLDTSGLTTGLTQAESAADRSLGKIDRRLTSIGESFTKVGTRLTIGVTAPLTALGAIGVRSAMQLETFAASLRVLIGDAEKANVVFDELYEFSANVPFDWRSLTEATRVLAAFGTEAEDVIDTLGMLGDIAAGVQMPIQDLAEAYGRVQVTGRITMLDINTLARNGINLWSEFATVLGVTEGEVRDLVSAGAVGFPELQAAFKNLTSEGGRFFGMMDAQSETTQGRLNRLKDSFEQVTDVIGERLLPIFDRLIAAGQAATDWFNNLDDASQRAIVGLGTMAAVLGPLLTTVGLLATQIPKVTAALAALRVGGLALAGPAGWAVLGVSALAGLSVALSGSSGVDSAADRARNAIASGDKSSFIGALKELKGYIDADLTSSLDALLDLLENVSMTAIGTVTLMQVADSVAALSAEVTAIDAEIRRLATAPSALDARLASDSGISIEERINTLLARRNMILEQINDTIELSTSLALEQAGIFEGSTRRATNAAASGVQALGTAGGDAARTIQGVFTDIEAAGVQAERRAAAFGNTAVAQAESASTRIRALNSGLTELLLDFGLDPIDERVQYIVSRIGELEARIERLRGVTLDLVQPWAEVAESVELVADAFATIPSSVQITAMPTATADTGGLRSIAAVESDLAAATARLRAAGTTEAQAAARAEVDVLLAELRRLRDGVALTAVAFSEVAESVPLAPMAFAAVPEARALTSGAFATVDTAGLRSIAEIDSELQRAREQLRTAGTEAGRIAAQALVDELEAELGEMVRRVTPISVEIEPFATVTETPLRFGGRAPFSGGDIGRTSGVETRAEADRRIAMEQASADRFAETVVSAGFRFGESAIQALKDGDIAGVIKAGISATQGILGGVSGGPMMSLLGGSVPVLGIISGVLGLIGGLIGGGRGESQRREQEARQRQRSVPAVNINFTMTQTNHITSQSTESGTAAMLRGVVSSALDEFLARTRLVERVTRLEGAA